MPPYNRDMRLTLQIHALPTEDQKAVLLETMERFNAAATFAARVGFEAGVFSQPSIHHRCYAEIRERFGLSAQMAVRAIGKAVETFKRDKKRLPEFRPRGAITYDERILGWKGLDRVSLWVLGGRMLLPIAYGEYQRGRLDRLKGQVDLVYRGGEFYLYATIDLPEGDAVEVHDFLGVDLGIVNIAADSDGNTYSGEQIEAVRRRHHRNRRSLQKRGTRSAKRRLKRLSGREARFRRDTNHRISKTLIQQAKGTGRGVALEELTHIRERTTVRAKDRARHSGWAFGQLRAFVEYKARLVGVPVVLVDPRDTSRTCAECGHCEKANRRSQAEFRCLACDHSTNADLNAARNVRARAVVSQLETRQAAA
jgi:putative transposase